jgi:hypothetical protein
MKRREWLNEILTWLLIAATGIVISIYIFPEFAGKVAAKMKMSYDNTIREQTNK